MLNKMEKMNKTLKRRRRRKLLKFAFLSVFLTVVGVVLINVFFVISVISIKNNTIYDSLDLLDGCKLNIGDGLFTFNKSVIYEQIPVKYPYVKAVDIKIRLPDKLELQFTTTKAYLSIKVNETVYINLDSDFKVLEESGSLTPGLLTILGMDIAEYKPGLPLDPNVNIEIDIVKDIISLLKENNLLDSLTIMDFSKKYNLFFVLEDRIKVEIGNGEDLDKKIKLLINIMERNKDYNKMIINVRNYKEGRCRILE